MTNKERYKRTFSALPASRDCVREVKAMKKTTKRYMPRALAASIAILLLLGLASVTYAADLGGIRRNVQVWVHGDQTNAVLEIENKESYSEYTLRYEDEEGKTHEQSGGGLAYGPFGKERPLTEEEILEELNAPELDYREDGSVWVYYREQKLEITDLFDENGVCYVQLKDGEDTLYMTVKGTGYSTSPHRFPNPRLFN